MVLLGCLAVNCEVWPHAAVALATQIIPGFPGFAQETCISIFSPLKNKALPKSAREGKRERRAEEKPRARGSLKDQTREVGLPESYFAGGGGLSRSTNFRRASSFSARSNADLEKHSGHTHTHAAGAAVWPVVLEGSERSADAKNSIESDGAGRPRKRRRVNQVQRTVAGRMDRVHQSVTRHAAASRAAYERLYAAFAAQPGGIKDCHRQTLEALQTQLQLDQTFADGVTVRHDSKRQRSLRGSSSAGEEKSGGGDGGDAPGIQIEWKEVGAREINQRARGFGEAVFFSHSAVGRET